LSLSVNRAIVRRADVAFLAEPAPTGAAVAPMAGVLNAAGIIAAPAAIGANLDPLADLIGTLEDNLSVPTAIVVDPQGWAQLRKIEDRRRYNSTLLGAGTEDAPPLLFSLPVYVNPGMTNYSGLVIDRSAIVSAVGSVLIATSEHQYFDSDSVGVRATWRFGQAVVRPTRIGMFAITPPGWISSPHRLRRQVPLATQDDRRSLSCLWAAS
jgi:HK97 family phage major capsid protein